MEEKQDCEESIENRFLAVTRAIRLACQADVIAALSIESLRGSVHPFDPSNACLSWNQGLI